MIDTFRAKYGAQDSTFTDDEVARAERLVEDKFGTRDWLYRVT